MMMLETFERLEPQQVDTGARRRVHPEILDLSQFVLFEEKSSEQRGKDKSDGKARMDVAVQGNQKRAPLNDIRGAIWTNYRE